MNELLVENIVLYFEFLLPKKHLNILNVYK